MLEFLLKRNKGSITVMVTMILIPTIFFTGFMTDLARIKLYGNQAVMTADNYGEAVIAEYDYLLKELYGLFAVTQDEQGLKALEELQSYMQTSFNPAKNKIDTSHLAGLLNVNNTEYRGFMPYQDAEVTLSYELVENSKLSNPEIMSTQIGDFMRFRIVQSFMGSDTQDTILNTLDEIQNAEKNSDVIEKKDDFDEYAGTVLEEMKKYYKIAKKLNKYVSYIRKINVDYEAAQNKFVQIVNGDSYKHYREYMDLTNNEKTILKEAKRKKAEDRSQEEEKLIEIEEAYQGDAEARYERLEKCFDKEITEYEESRENKDVDFDTFDILCGDLKKQAAAVDSELKTLQQKKEKLDEALNQEGISSDLKNGIEEDLKLLDELTDGTYSGQNYIALANHIASNNLVNGQYSSEMQDQIEKLKQIRNEYLAVPKAASVSPYKPSLDLDKYQDFQKQREYQKLYASLDKCFANANNSELEKNAKSQKNKAEVEKEESENELSKEETTPARDIPNQIENGDNGTGGGFSLTDLIKTASNYFKAGSLANAGNKLLLKFYTVVYDFGMFSSRITNLSADEEKTASLTGVTMGPNVNYLYQAELEYLFGGHKSSQMNLEAAKNYILAFRAVENTTATYRIKVIDRPIKTVRDSLAAINPILGIAAAAALRSGVVALETAADWKELKEGKSVVLIKSDIRDTTAYDEIKSLIGIDETAQNAGSSKLALDYNQYLMIMVTFLTTSDQVIARTADLISLNVSAVKEKIGDSGELSKLVCDLNKAYTAVDATCAVHLDFAVMPKGFAQKVMERDTYQAVVENEKNVYKVTVTRGY